MVLTINKTCFWISTFTKRNWTPYQRRKRSYKCLDISFFIYLYMIKCCKRNKRASSKSIYSLAKEKQNHLSKHHFINLIITYTYNYKFLKHGIRCLYICNYQNKISIPAFIYILNEIIYLIRRERKRKKKNDGERLLLTLRDQFTIKNDDDELLLWQPYWYLRFVLVLYKEKKKRKRKKRVNRGF